MGVLWAAHQSGGLPHIPEDSTQEEFAEHVLDWLSLFNSVFVIEDRNKEFSGKAVVGMVLVLSNGEIVIPLPYLMPWTTPRNMLCGTVAFLNFVKNSTHMRVCVIDAAEDEHKMMLRQRDYGHKAWHIGWGTWVLRGRKPNARRPKKPKLSKED